MARNSPEKNLNSGGIAATLARSSQIIREKSIDHRQRLSTVGITTGQDGTMREQAMNKPLRRVARTNRDSERCVIASATHPQYRFGQWSLHPSVRCERVSPGPRPSAGYLETCGRPTGGVRRPSPNKTPSGGVRRPSPNKTPSGGVGRPSPNETSPDVGRAARSGSPRRTKLPLFLGALADFRGSTLPDLSCSIPTGELIHGQRRAD